MDTCCALLHIYSMTPGQGPIMKLGLLDDNFFRKRFPVHYLGGLTKTEKHYGYLLCIIPHLLNGARVGTNYETRAIGL